MTFIGPRQAWVARVGIDPAMSGASVEKLVRTAEEVLKRKSPVIRPGRPRTAGAFELNGNLSKLTEYAEEVRWKAPRRARRTAPTMSARLVQSTSEATHKPDWSNHEERYANRKYCPGKRAEAAL